MDIINQTCLKMLCQKQEKTVLIFRWPLPMIKIISICFATTGFSPVFNRPFVWKMGNPTLLQQKWQKLGQFFQSEKLSDNFYV